MKRSEKLISVLCSLVLILCVTACVYAAENNLTVPDECEHRYRAVDYVGVKVVYECTECENVISILKKDLVIIWDVQYVNKEPSFENISQYLDVNDDGIINAKDYAIIIHED